MILASFQTTNSILSVCTSKEPELNGLKTTLLYTSTKNAQEEHNKQKCAKKCVFIIWCHSCNFLILNHHKIILDISIMVLFKTITWKSGLDPLIYNTLENKFIRHNLFKFFFYIKLTMPIKKLNINDLFLSGSIRLN